MKKTILSLGMSMLLFFAGTSMMSCEKKQKSEEQAPVSEEQADETAAYACPMHPEITGKKGDACSKCGMDLTEVKDHDHSDH